MKQLMGKGKDYSMCERPHSSWALKSIGLTLFAQIKACLWPVRCIAKTPAARPDLSSRLLLSVLSRLTLRNPSARTSAPATQREALALLRKVTNRPSFPVRLSSLQVRRVYDLAIPGAEALRPARLYIPYGRVRGIVLFLHGGGFVHCGLQSHHGICCRLARASGAAVLSFDYRLAPEHKFPAAPEDCWAALRWVASEAWRWGGKVAVAGDSAGGALAAGLAQRVRDADRKRVKGRELDPAIEFVAQVLFYPVTHGEEDFPSRHQFADGYFLSRSMLEWYGAQYARDRIDLSDPLFSPGLASDLSGLAPACVYTAACDPLRDEGECYAKAMEKAGVSVRYKCVGGTIHGFLNFYPIIRNARRTIQDAGLFLAEHFR